MRSGVRFPSWSAGLVAIGAAVAFPGCDSGPQSTTETTPPTLTWSVLNQENNERQDLPADGTVNAGPNDHYLITFKANDDGGVEKIAFDGEAQWRCDAGNVAQNKHALYKPQSNTLHPDSNGQVEHYAFLLTTISPNGWDCQSGFNFAGGEATLNGSATNYSNRTATGKLSIKRP